MKVKGSDRYPRSFFLGVDWQESKQVKLHRSTTDKSSAILHLILHVVETLHCSCKSSLIIKISSV